MGNQFITSEDPTEDDWLNSNSTPYITAIKVINDGRKIAIWAMKNAGLKSPKNCVVKKYAVRAAPTKATTPTMMFIRGDLENPVGVELLTLFARTEARAKIFAKCKMSLKFKVQLPSSVSESLNNVFYVV